MIVRLANRLLACALAAALVAGSLIVWIAIPAGFMWLSSRTAGSLVQALAILLIACPLAMVAFAFVLAKLNRAYLRASGAHPDQQHSAWLDSLRSGGRAVRRAPPVLEVSMTISAALALVALLVWFLFFAHSPLPAPP